MRSPTTALRRGRREEQARPKENRPGELQTGEMRRGMRAGRGHRRSNARAAGVRTTDRRGQHNRGAAGQVRIIAGSWRGRRLPVADAPGLRPTTDRVRETLFNWLQDVTAGARCLDLFAGSGALGLEALSRGAAHCTFVDLDTRNLKQIGAVLAELGAGERGRCAPGCARAFLGQPQSPYDLIFLDPPFGSGMLTQVALQLEQSGFCLAQTRIYVERDSHDQNSTLPAHWQALREKCAGSVRYGLYLPTAPAES